jgi:DtxR family transcriptional regulator, Mn-dependent transcriptional regulator
VTALIDSTEMYLRTLYELREEGIPPLRARFVERLHVSAPAASESTFRLAHEGLVSLADDRTVQFTEKGLARATAVMRKHRLAELLLTKVIGLDWSLVHNEACRWEHVISDEVEARLTDLLGDPGYCPFGNVIPNGRGEETASDASAPRSLLAAAEASRRDDTPVTIGWISERLQADEEIMRRLRDAGIVPGNVLAVRTRGDVVEVRAADAGEESAVELSRRAASLVYVGS